MPSPRLEPDASDLLTGAARLERWRRAAGIVLSPAVFFLAYGATQGTELTVQGRLLAAILAGVSVLWLTETLPLAVSAVMGACACVLLGVADAKTVFAPFADPIVFLFLGSFILARAMSLHGLDQRFALSLLSLPWVGERPLRLLAGLGLVTAAISMWVSNTATAAMITPIALGMLKAIEGEPRDRVAGQHHARATPLASGLLLMVAYAASIGGIATPVGSPPNLITIGLLRDNANLSVSFFEWMSLTLPLMAVMFVVLLLLLRVLFPPQAIATEDATKLRGHLRQQAAMLGPWTAGQRNTLIAFGVAVVLWILPGLLAAIFGGESATVKFINDRLPEAVVALLAAGLLFVLPVNLAQRRFTISLPEAMQIDWGTLLLFGGGLSLGTLMFKLGVSKWLGEGLTEFFGTTSVWGLTALAVALGIVLSELSSNTAAANMLVPVIIELALQSNAHPGPPALGACLGASFGFMLPVSTPPNAIVYGTGRVPILRMVRAGILFDLAGFVIIVAGLRVLCPLVGWGH
jgi:sodium-dependent dicarboxylate transporter 2/3/5